MVRWVGAGTVLGATVLAGQVVRAAYRNVPSFEGLELSGTFGEEHLPPLRLVIVGDSTVTAPGLDDPNDSWARLAALRLSDRYRVELLSLAVGGAKSRDVLAEQLAPAVAAHPDIAVVSVGSNDVMRFVPVWRFEERLDEIVAGLTDVSGEVVLFGVGDLGSIPRLPFPLHRIAGSAGHVADWVHRRVAARHGAAKIDQWTLTTAAFNSGPHMFAPDLFHPSPAGHRAWADAVMPTLEGAVARLEACRRG